MKYNHLPDDSLKQAIKVGDRYIHTKDGVYKIRKNGRVKLTLSYNTEWHETIKVTPIKK